MKYVQGKKAIFNLPPDITAIEVAAKGEYYLKSTGEIVVNPDYVAIWTIEENT